MAALSSLIRLVSRAAPGSEVGAQGTQQGDAFVTKHIPDYTTLVQAGLVWQVQDLTTTAVLVAAPTTTAGLVVQNPTKDKYYVVFALKGYTDVVPATLGMVSVWHCAHKLAVNTLFTRDIALSATGAGTISGLKAGQGAYPGEIILDRNATVVDDGWSPTPLQIESNIATTNFVSKEAALSVPVIIPPSYHYSLQGIATVVTFELGIGLVWAELGISDLR